MKIGLAGPHGVATSALLFSPTVASAETVMLAPMTLLHSTDNLYGNGSRFYLFLWKPGDFPQNGGLQW